MAPIRELYYSAVPYTEHIYPGIILLLMLAGTVLFIRHRSIESYWALMCCSALWGILILAIWYASHIRPILVSRYLIMSMCLCVLGVSSIARCLNRYMVIAVCLLCTLTGSLRYQSAFLTQRNRITTRTVTFITENQNQADANGSIWLFDSSQYMPQSPTGTMDYTVTDCGTFGFGTDKFKIYELEKQP